MRVDKIDKAEGIIKLKNPSPFCISNRLFLYRGSFLQDNFLKVFLCGESLVFTRLFTGAFPFKILIAHSHRAFIKELGHFCKSSLFRLLFARNFK